MVSRYTFAAILLLAGAVSSPCSAGAPDGDVAEKLPGLYRSLLHSTAFVVVQEEKKNAAHRGNGTPGR